jgi:hypothetical protein
VYRSGDLRGIEEPLVCGGGISAEWLRSGGIRRKEREFPICESFGHAFK